MGKQVKLESEVLEGLISDAETATKEISYREVSLETGDLDMAFVAELTSCIESFNSVIQDLYELVNMDLKNINKVKEVIINKDKELSK